MILAHQTPKTPTHFLKFENYQNEKYNTAFFINFSPFLFNEL